MEVDIQSPEFWIEQWEGLLAQTAWSGKYGYTTPGVWDLMAADYGSGTRQANRRANETDLLIGILEDRGLFPEAARVLDVGCGTGRIAIPFALRGADVTALDFSEGMLSRLRENITDETVHRIRPVQANWDEIDLERKNWHKSFDLVVACMTPAIRTPASFLKLHRASRHGCCFRGWAGKREDPLLESIWTHILGEPMPVMGWDITLAFNLLRAMDLSPTIEFSDVCWEREEGINKAAAFFAGYFAGLTDDPPETLKNKILVFLEEISENGLIRRRTAGQTGTMTWSVK